MGIYYYKLFDRLTRNNIKKKDLQSKANISSATMSKLTKGKAVTTDIVDRICAALNCQPGDIMEWVPEVKEEERDEHARK